MTHFEDFDPRKAASERAEDEKRLREALHALNRAIDPARDDQEKLVNTRDQVWDLGVKLYGWTD